MARRRRGRLGRWIRGLAIAVAAVAALLVASVVAMRWIDPPFTA
jgi:hypothetical protein